MRKAYVYARNDAIYVVALVMTKGGVTINSDHVTRLDKQVPPQILGQAILDALGIFMEGAPELADWRDHAAPMLRATGFTSLRAFERGACFVNIIERDGTITVIPTVRLKRGGFIALSDLPNGGDVQCNRNAEEIGKAVYGRLELCRERATASSQ